jgi:hypothetical protein
VHPTKNTTREKKVVVVDLMAAIKHHHLRGGQLSNLFRNRAARREKPTTTLSLDAQPNEIM